MATLHTVPKISAGTEGLGSIEVRASALEGQHGMFGENQSSHPRGELGLGVYGANMPDVYQTSAVPPRPQLTRLNPDRPVRYIPIHVWPEHLKKVQPRTGRRYCPKRSRTLSKRNEPSPLVREYQYVEDESVLPCEGRGFSDTESTDTGDPESADRSTISTMVKRRGWGHALLGAVQSAVPKRQKEEKHFTSPRKPSSLTPLRLGHHPPGLRKRGSRESFRR